MMAGFSALPQPARSRKSIEGSAQISWFRPARLTATDALPDRSVRWSLVLRNYPEAGFISAAFSIFFPGSSFLCSGHTRSSHERHTLRFQIVLENQDLKAIRFGLGRRNVS